MGRWGRRAGAPPGGGAGLDPGTPELRDCTDPWGESSPWRDTEILGDTEPLRVRSEAPSPWGNTDP